MGSDIGTRFGKQIQLALEFCSGEKTPKTARAEIVRLVQGLRDAGECSRYLQGGIFGRVRDGKLWLGRDNEDQTFGEWVEEQFGIQRKTAAHYIVMYERATLLGLGPDKIDTLGWTKARAVLRIATRESLDAWLDRAEKKTQKELEHEVSDARKSRRATPSDDAPARLDVLKFMVTADERQNIEGCVETACDTLRAGQSGIVFARGTALNAICSEWTLSRMDAERSLQWFVEQVERRFGVEITVRERKTG